MENMKELEKEYRKLQKEIASKGGYLGEPMNCFIPSTPPKKPVQKLNENDEKKEDNNGNKKEK